MLVAPQAILQQISATVSRDLDTLPFSCATRYRALVIEDPD